MIVFNIEVMFNKLIDIKLKLTLLTLHTQFYKLALKVLQRTWKPNLLDELKVSSFLNFQVFEVDMKWKIQHESNIGQGTTLNISLIYNFLKKNLTTYNKPTN
jgi:hypothetical protein